MLFVLAVLCLAVFGIQGAEDKLPSYLRDTFEEINQQYNGNLKWNECLANKALEEAVNPQSVLAYLKIRGTKKFSKKDCSTNADKVRAAFKNPFDRMGNRVIRLPEGTIYGCNGVVDTDAANLIFTVACVYNNTKLRTVRA
ncbi:hypothetical protein V3C99_016705 [Haemonchus contortus]|uniref:RNAse_Pc domain-containing protein n=1 Tax=Haemonchus contortus TaxID=6289 RepID=A0A7I4YZX3_HAECO|nr:p15 [Haemonchus contortus]